MKVALFASIQFNFYHTYSAIMKVRLIICFVLLSQISCFKSEYLKTSVSDPLFLVKPPSKEGVAVANLFIIEIYLNEQISSNFYLSKQKNHISSDTVSSPSPSATLQSNDKQMILGNLKQNMQVSRTSPGYSYRLKKHLIMDAPICGIYWGQKYFIVETVQVLYIYNSDLNFIMTYQLTDNLLSMTSIDSNVYLLFQNPKNTTMLNQIILSFQKNNFLKQSTVPIELLHTYKMYQYFMNDYEWLYLVNETHVKVYDILNKKIKSIIQSKFDHPITKFRVDDSDSLAIASNQFGDYLFIAFSSAFLTAKNTNYTYAAFCSSEYIVIGNSHSFQVMEINEKYLSSEQAFDADNVQAIECRFTADLNLIYGIDKSGYIGIYFESKTSWGIVVVIVIIIFALFYLKQIMQKPARQQHQHQQRMLTQRR